jgi:hypothetical protein
VNEKATKQPTGEMARRIALGLKLPADYFIEARVARIVSGVEADPELREDFYRRTMRRRR